MKPSVKTEQVEDVIADIFGVDRREAIWQNRCAPKPIGCGRDIVPELDFRNELSCKEFTVSGLCQGCQDSVFGYDEPDTAGGFAAEMYPPPKPEPTVGSNDFLVSRQPMISGQGEAQNRCYHQYIDSSGKTWLVADQPNAGDNIYVEGGPNSDGFGGATLTFALAEGGEVKLKGPWHTNADALFAATGVDVRDKFYTFVVISRDREYGHHLDCVMKDVLYKDDDWTLGTFKRGDALACETANRLGHKVCLYSVSRGGSSSSYVYPEGKEPRHCKDCISWHSPGEHKVIARGLQAEQDNEADERAEHPERYGLVEGGV